MEENIQYFDAYEENLQREILRMCTSLGMLDGELLSSEDIDQKWKEWAPEYIAEALPDSMRRICRNGSSTVVGSGLGTPSQRQIRKSSWSERI